MPTSAYLISAVLVSMAVTWGLRAAPFALVSKLRESALVTYLGVGLPAGVMLVLVVYTLRDHLTPEATTLVPAVVGVGAVIGLHLWKSSMLLSVFGGTAVYVLLASFAATLS